MMFIKKAPNSHGFVNPRHLEEMWRDQFDWVYREHDCAVFRMTIHPDVSARPQVLARLNPAALLLEAATSTLDAAALLTQDSYDPDSKSAEVRGWFAAERRGDAAVSPHHHDAGRHDAEIDAFCLVFDRPIDWTAFGIWLSMLLNDRGDDILRVKGLLNVRGSAAPVVVQGVQRLVHPPVHLAAWPDADRRSSLAFIARRLARDAVERSLGAFNRLVNDPRPAPALAHAGE
jgi:G3E family GTPase